MAFDLSLRDNGAGTFDLDLAAGGGSTTVTPAEGAGTGAAYDAAIKVTVAPTGATGTGAADDAGVVTGVIVPAIESTGTGTAYDAAPSVSSAPVAATGTGTANDGAIRVTVAPSAATGVGAADDPGTSSSSVIADGTAGNNTTPSITLSAGIQEGQVIVLLLTQNNTDVITSAPSELIAQDGIAPTGGGQGAANLYLMIADATTAGSTLSWTLSATRNWNIVYIAMSDIDQDPLAAIAVFESASDTVASTTTFTAPSATTGATGYVIEFFAPKANGTALTGITPPSGYTERFERLSSSGTFGMNTSVATRDGNPSAGGTYGGDTWTTSAACVTSFRYTVILRQRGDVSAGIGQGEASDATIAITVYPAEAAGTGVAHFDTAGTSASLTLIAENPIYGFGEAFDATVTTAVITTAPAELAAGTGAAADAAASVRAVASEAPGVGAALDAAVSITVAPGAATGTGSSEQPAVAVTEPGTEGAGSGSAFDATVSVRVYPDAAAGAGAADDPQVFAATDGTATPTVAAGTGTAYAGAVSITVSADAALGAGSTYDVTVTTTANVLPGELLGVGSAYDAPVIVTPNAGSAGGTGAASDGTLALTVPPAALTGAGAAYDASAAVTYPAGGATGTGLAGTAVVSITVYPDAAYGAGAAYALTPNPGSRGSVKGGPRPPRPTVTSGSRPTAVGAGTRGAPGLASAGRVGPRVDGSRRVTSTTEGGTP